MLKAMMLKLSLAVGTLAMVLASNGPTMAAKQKSAQQSLQAITDACARKYHRRKYTDRQHRANLINQCIKQRQRK